MRYVRAFAVLCFAFGLFVQVAAQAAAMPLERPERTIDCSAMMAGGAGHSAAAEEQPADEDWPCERTLECLVAMNCLSPLVLPDRASQDTAAMSAEADYQARESVRLTSSPIPPESPPPQSAAA